MKTRIVLQSFDVSFFRVFPSEVAATGEANLAGPNFPPALNRPSPPVPDTRRRLRCAHQETALRGALKNGTAVGPSRPDSRGGHDRTDAPCWSYAPKLATRTWSRRIALAHPRTPSLRFAGGFARPAGLHEEKSVGRG